jgi:hypothetical protein
MAPFFSMHYRVHYLLTRQLVSSLGQEWQDEAWRALWEVAKENE